MSGLSPRVRGNQGYDLAWSRYQRSIPARAGEPLTATPGDGEVVVYPRACGGT